MISHHDVLACETQLAGKLMDVDKRPHTQYSRQGVGLVGGVGIAARVILQNINLKNSVHMYMNADGRCSSCGCHDNRYEK